MVYIRTSIAKTRDFWRCVSLYTSFERTFHFSRFAKSVKKMPGKLYVVGMSRMKSVGILNYVLCQSMPLTRRLKKNHFRPVSKGSSVHFFPTQQRCFITRSEVQDSTFIWDPNFLASLYLLSCEMFTLGTWWTNLMYRSYIHLFRFHISGVCRAEWKSAKAETSLSFTLDANALRCFFFVCFFPSWWDIDRRIATFIIVTDKCIWACECSNLFVVVDWMLSLVILAGKIAAIT